MSLREKLRTILPGRSVYLVKTKQWPRNMMHCVQRDDDVYIVYNSDHKSGNAYVLWTITHELGHCVSSSRWFWLRELKATFWGAWYFAKPLGLRTNWLRLLRDAWLDRWYWWRTEKNGEAYWRECHIRHATML